jgi:hypothetical protein
MSKFVKIIVTKEITSEINLEVPDDCDLKALQRYEYAPLIKKACIEIEDVFMDDCDWDADISANGWATEISEEEFDEFSHYTIEDCDRYPKIKGKE